MNRILLIHSSPRGEASLSYRVARGLVEGLRSIYPAARVTARDLSRVPPPQVGEVFVRASALSADQLSPEDALVLQSSDELIGELRSADLLVLAVPMHNFGVPSTLKAWIDNVVRARHTFAYGPNGPQGLLDGKRAVLVIASGGVYSYGPAKGVDFVEPYLRAILGSIGITVVDTIRAEGTAFGDDGADKAFASAHAQTEALLATLQPSTTPS